MQGSSPPTLSFLPKGLVPCAVNHPAAACLETGRESRFPRFPVSPLLSFCLCLGLLFLSTSSFFHLLSPSLPLSFSPLPFLALSSGPFQSAKRNSLLMISLRPAWQSITVGIPQL